MALYVYKKAPPQVVSPPSKMVTKAKRLAPAVLITLGSVLIANVSWPIIHYELFVSPGLKRTQLITPINESKTAFFSPLGSSPNQNATNQPDQILGQEVDYTRASNWFPTANFPQNNESKISHYTVSIPKVNIESAVVEIGGEDLSKSTIQYPGTANPGQPGSPVIFGHSILRQFYNPDINNPNRYISIFSKIMTLEEGDEIYVDFDGIRYKYTVSEKVEVQPEDIFILQQRHDRRELKLITCVPEGTYLRRGVIIAQLQDIN